MVKQEGFDYIYNVLENYGCENFRVMRGSTEIRCGCPYHSPKGDSSAFKIKFPQDREPFYHCHKCKENGDLPKLLSFVNKISYKKALKVIGKKTTLGRVSIENISNIFDSLCNAYNDISTSGQKTDRLPEPSDNQTPMYNYLKKRKENAHSILDVDWIVRKYSMFYCSSGRMSKRIIMPINIGGKQVSYNDRSVFDKAQLKSLHPKNGDFENLVHGLDESAGKEIGIVVEGSFDMYQVMSFLKQEDALDRYGCVCLMNANLSEGKAGLIAGAFDKVHLLLDHDEAGLLGTKQGMKMLDDVVEVYDKTQYLPKGVDPGRMSSTVLERVILKKNKKRRRSYIDGVLKNL